MKTMTVKELINVLNASLDACSIKEDTEVVYSNFYNTYSNAYSYEFNVDFLWDTVEED